MIKYQAIVNIYQKYLVVRNWLQLEFGLDEYMHI